MWSWGIRSKEAEKCFSGMLKWGMGDMIYEKRKEKNDVPGVDPPRLNPLKPLALLPPLPLAPLAR